MRWPEENFCLIAFFFALEIFVPERKVFAAEEKKTHRTKVKEISALKMIGVQLHILLCKIELI